MSVIESCFDHQIEEHPFGPVDKRSAHLQFVISVGLIVASALVILASIEVYNSGLPGRTPASVEQPASGVDSGHFGSLSRP